MLRKYGSRVLMLAVSLILLASMSFNAATPVLAGDNGSGQGWFQDLINAQSSNNGDKQFFSDGFNLKEEGGKQDDIVKQSDPNSVVQQVIATANLTEGSNLDQPENGRNAFLAAVLNNSYSIVGDPLEVDFMQFMLTHHVVAVYMANACVQKAEHAELRDLCQTIALSQAKQVFQQGYLLASYYGLSTHVSPLEQDEFILDKLSGLSGSAFDKAFLELMNPHHAQAVVTAKVCANGAEHDNVKQLCQAIVYVQTQEIQQMADMLKSWYGESMTTDPMKLAMSIQDAPFSGK